MLICLEEYIRKFIICKGIRGMKVLHINCNYLTTALHQTMIEKLEAIGVISDVFAPTYNAKMKVIIPNRNVYVAECFEKWDRLLFDYKQLKIYTVVDKHYKVQEYNCIHAYTLFTDGNIAMKLSKKYNKPYVVAIRDTDVNTFFKYMPHLRSRGVKIMKNASKVFFLSETYRKFVLDTYVSKEDYDAIYKKSMVIPNGIDDFWLDNIYKYKQFKEVNKRLQEKEIRIVCVAQIIKRKNIPMLQKAVDILNKKGWNITIKVIGKAIDQTLLEQIQGYKSTTYCGPVIKEKLINYYRDADIFVLPSKRETFGLVYAEAMTQGLPVIYTRGQGFDGQFQDGEIGYSVGQSDVNELVTIIEKIRSRYIEIGKLCLKRCLKFDWDIIVEQYYKIYEGICEKK